ncbi:glycoside hydrolase family 16 protein [Lactarius indigo]|nr:glycoside hydrolase family 16 protein [Lactarius indigo]
MGSSKDGTGRPRTDPTHGRVNYVSQAEAQGKNLAYGAWTATGRSSCVRTTGPSSTTPPRAGRDSVRISSQNAYDEAIFVLDLKHMPAGCSTWPAFWTLSKGCNPAYYPKLHECPPIYGANRRLERPAETNCDTAANFNAGCGFNSAGGGYFVMYKGRESVKVWFYPRAGYVPSVIRDGAQRGRPVYPDLTWGFPAANFPFDSRHCNYDQHFDAHQIVFDLTFCVGVLSTHILFLPVADTSIFTKGDWAGSANVWLTSGCGSGTCPDFVDKNPGAFGEAYWAINSLRVYTP